MIQEAIQKLANGEDLTNEMVEAVMDEIMSGEASPVHMSAYLIALRMKGETTDEITASAVGMRKHSLHLNPEADVLEIVGTGGDESNSFNISTTASIVMSAAGIPVAKHGNRSVSSKCGAADVLEALGVNISIKQEKMEAIFKEIGIGFMFAQIYHSAMKHVGPIRRELATKTVFNILGPLTNPANANMQLMGVYAENLVEPMAQVLQNLGVKRGMVVYGQDGLDEISLSAPTTCCEIQGDKLTSYVLSPKDFGINPCTKEALLGGDSKENAKITKAILNGELGPKRDAVLINAAACLHFIKNISFEQGVKMAAQVIDSGKAIAKLNEFIQATNA